MIRNRKWLQLTILALFVLIGVWTLGSSLTGGGTKLPEKGSKAPDIRAVGLDGSAKQLSDYKGQPVVLNFWGTFCLPCRNEMPALQRAADKWGSSGVQVIGMNLGENAVTVKSFLEQYEIRFPVLLDREDAIRKRYGVMSYPTTFFIRADGTIMEKKVGEMDDAYLERTLTALTAGG